MENKFTIKVIKTAFYNGGLVYPNEIIKNYKGETIPSWATLANGKEASAQKDDANSSKKEDTVEKEEKAEVVVAGDGGVHKIPADNADAPAGGQDDSSKGSDNTGVNAEQTEAEIIEEYNTLLDEAVEKNILLEDADKKTIIEQIAELKKLLGKE